MIYTIGHTESYLRYFAEQYPQPVQKLGKTNDYPGGSVWETYKEARANCPKDHSVFGVLADWEKDTEINESENYRNLIKTSDLAKLFKEK